MVNSVVLEKDNLHLIIGGGPAGLTAAYELTRLGLPVTVYEQDLQVGGLARTVEYRGFRFDIGGHRFFTKNIQVRELWQKLLGDDLLTRPRLSRIYYGGKFFDYPLRPVNALKGMGVIASLAVLFSYLRRKVVPIRPEDSFSAWVTNRFGDKLYRMFFESYTEKVWGIPCRTISAEWAAQRIKGLSLRTAIMAMFFPIQHATGGGTIKTLIDEFYYPRFGPGMMWDALRDAVESQGGDVVTNARIETVCHDGTAITEVTVIEGGVQSCCPVSHLISTMPLRSLVRSFRPPAPEKVLAAAGRLRYRDFLTVALVVDVPDLFTDNWIYIHDPKVSVGRIQNFKNWSPDMVPDPKLTCLGMEYFCNENDQLWSMTDNELVRLAARELAAVGIAREELVSDGVVVRMPKAYPVYDEEYPQAVATIRDYLDLFINLQVIGRNGMHRYNNMDHSMLTGMMAVRNLSGEKHDLWAINADEEYHEIDNEHAK
jgi:protoporphyrinogen oxidase